MKNLISHDVTHSSFIDYYGESRPAGETTWDFFELSPLNRQNLACSIGRVTGSGIAASFTLASLQAFLRGISPYHGANAAELMRDLNRIIYEISPDDFYSSLFYAWIDPVRGQLDYASAGHAPAWLVHQHDCRVSRLENTGTVLGLSLRVNYRKSSVPLEPSDLLIVASDGVTDSLCDDEILRIARREKQARPASVVRDILDSTRPSRDCTVVAIRMKERLQTGVFQASAAEVAFAAA